MNNQEFSTDEIQQLIKKHYKKVIIVIVLLIVGFGSFFQVGTEEEGVVTRFGKHVRTVTPGLKMKIPFMETVYKVPVERQKKQEFGFKIHFFACYRMNKGKLLSMQTQSFHGVCGGSVFFIANYAVPQFLHVNPNLVFTPGFEIYF
jgi:hypothetical protein